MAEHTQRRLGLIGLGLLGSAMAERFLQHDFHVVGFDIDPTKRAHLVKLGGEATDSPASVASTCERIVLSLPDSSIASGVIDATDTSLSKGAIIVDTTTGAPKDSETFAERLSGRGVQYLDATVLGSSEQARQGQVVTMVGGDEQAYESCKDLFDCFSSECYYLGSSGNGARMKLVANLAIGLHRAVLAEALTFGQSLGFDASTILEILKSGAAYSRAMEVKGEKMIQRDFHPQARLAQHRKDVGLMLELAEESESQLPLTALHAELLQRVIESGFGGEDNSAILRAFENDEGETPKETT